MAEITNNVVCSELVENPRVKDSNQSMIVSNVASQQNEKAVSHNSESHVRLRMASIPKFVFEKVNLAVVFDWIVLTKQVHG